jgi:hypothetical protein
MLRIILCRAGEQNMCAPWVAAIGSHNVDCRERDAERRRRRARRRGWIARGCGRVGWLGEKRKQPRAEGLEQRLGVVERRERFGGGGCGRRDMSRFSACRSASGGRLRRLRFGARAGRSASGALRLRSGERICAPCGRSSRRARE